MPKLKLENGKNLRVILQICLYPATIETYLLTEEIENIDGADIMQTLFDVVGKNGIDRFFEAIEMSPWDEVDVCVCIKDALDSPRKYSKGEIKATQTFNINDLKAHIPDRHITQLHYQICECLRHIWDEYHVNQSHADAIDIFYKMQDKLKEGNIKIPVDEEITHSKIYKNRLYVFTANHTFEIVHKDNTFYFIDIKEDENRKHEKIL